MKVWRIGVLIAVIVGLYGCGVSGGFESEAPQPQVVHEWVNVEYFWESEEQRERYVNSSLYINENCCITGIKYWNGNTYVTVPRWRRGVPFTLNILVQDSNSTQTLLKPFPDIASQDLSVSDSPMIRYVQSMEIDSQGRMWIIDVGRLNIFEPNTSLFINGPAHLYILDLKTNTFIRNYTFPDSVVPYNNSFLNDIVIDQVNWFAYISSTWGNGSIIVYDYDSNSSYAFHNEHMNIDWSKSPIPINGGLYAINAPEDGIALTADVQTLYFCPLTATHLYSIPTTYLRNWNDYTDEARAAAVFSHGEKGYSDGMAFSNNGNLYFGSNSENAVKGWKVNGQEDVISNSSDSNPVFVLNEDAVTNQWIDTFAFDGNGSLLYTSNRLELYFNYTMDFSGKSGSNFRIWKVWIDGDSYLEGVKGDGGDKKGVWWFVVGGVVFGIVILILVIIAGVVGYLFYNKKDEYDQQYSRLDDTDPDGN